MKGIKTLMGLTILMLCGASVGLTSCRSNHGVTKEQMTTKPVVLNCVKPDYLKQGDKVALISPSYYISKETVTKAADVLRSWGLEPVIGPNVDKVVDGQYAGTLSERLSDIRWAWKDPTIKAIICNRGGYGSIQLINDFSYNQLKASPKWLVGFSDITTFHGLLNRAGVMSIHGTMSVFLANGGTDSTSTLMRDLLMGQVPHYQLPAHPQNIMGKASGVLVGGNLCTFTPNLGSQADATMGRDIILFIEEDSEEMHNIDRQMRILQMNGVLNRCKGVILGEFTDCSDEFTDEDGQTISAETIIHRILQPYHIPVLCGFPAGHDKVNLPLIMGAHVTIDVNNDGATLQFNIDSKPSRE